MILPNMTTKLLAGVLINVALMIVHVYSITVPHDKSKSDPVVIEKFSLKNCGLNISRPVIIDDEGSFKEFIKSNQCSDLSDTIIDFSKHTLIVAAEEFADCNAHFEIEVEKDEIEKSYNILIEEEYGGCRGMNSFGIFIVIEKIAADYQVGVKKKKSECQSFINTTDN